ncbi:hypothetical protein HNP69_000812 [Chryseobacterium koreense]|nr:hypothetical protein [Chryseobacterium koreense]
MNGFAESGAMNPEWNLGGNESNQKVKIKCQRKEH